MFDRFTSCVSRAIDFLQTYNGAVGAVATVFIAIFTIVLAVISRRQAILTRQSVRIAERALTELERPYLFILDYNWLLTEKAKANDTKYGWSYFVMNGGKLPAVITGVKYGVKFGQSIPFMDDAPHVHGLLTAPVIGGGEKREIINKLVDEGGDPPHECEIRDGIATIPGSAFRYERVIAKVSVEYDGPVTRGHVTTACWEWHPVKHAFTQHGGPEHNQRT